MNNLKGKVVIVTGATGVLGGAFLETLSREGVKLVVMGRNQEVAEQRANSIVDAGGEAIPVVGDVLDNEVLQQAADIIMKKFGRIDGLVNGAGGNIKEAVIQPEDDLFSMDMDAMRKVVDLNLYGTVLPTLVFGGLIAKSGGGSIVNISSMSTIRAITKVLGYSMGKAGVDNFTRWMSVELANRYGDKMRINAISPGFFITEQNRALLTKPDGTLTERGEKVIRNTPYKRFGEPSELCGILKWLLGDESRFVSGQIIPVDGGFSIFSGV